jgi:chaperone modulatory protein CbpM
MTQQTLTAVYIDDEQIVSLAQLCRGCDLPAEQVVRMIEYGIIEPLETSTTVTRWNFSADCVPRLQTVIRLQRDLNVNLAGAALALDLLDEVKFLRQQVQALSRD